MCRVRPIHHQARFGNYNRPARCVNCKCDCGTEKWVRGDYLINGRSKSCGCLRSEQAKLKGKIQKTKTSASFAKKILFAVSIGLSIVSSWKIRESGYVKCNKFGQSIIFHDLENLTGVEKLTKVTGVEKLTKAIHWTWYSPILTCLKLYLGHDRIILRFCFA